MFDGGSCSKGEVGCHTLVVRVAVSTADRAGSDVFDLAAQKHQQHDQNDTQKQTVL